MSSFVAFLVKLPRMLYIRDTVEAIFHISLSKAHSRGVFRHCDDVASLVPSTTRGVAPDSREALAMETLGRSMAVKNYFLVHGLLQVNESLMYIP